MQSQVPFNVNYSLNEGLVQVREENIPDIDFKLDGLGRKLGELGGQVQVGQSLPIQRDQTPK